MNGMVISAAPVKSVGTVTVETKPGMTEKEKSDLEEELEMIKLRLQKTERELDEEKKLTRSQVFDMTTTLHTCMYGVMGRFPFTDFWKISIGNFRLGRACSICHKFHSRKPRDTWLVKRPRKVWNW